jgi:hypothetical protein
MSLKKFTIYGERCSGTNYLEEIILINFNVELTWEFGWKHFFGFQDELLKNSDDTLFICVVRNLCPWINSLYREKWHLPLKYMQMIESKKIDKFLNDEFWSFDDNNRNRDINKEIMEDRNIYTGLRYKNIFELRHTKNKFLIEDMPKKVKNYIFIRYEDLLNDFENTMLKIKEKGLEVKNPSSFPKNSSNYKKSNINFHKIVKKDHIPNDVILQNPNLIKEFEEILGYM